jgi:4-hydroxy-4-methyl-2-oxoglutarate aldolase
MRHRIISEIDRPDPQWVEKFKQVSVPIIAIQLGRSQKMDPRIKPVGDRDLLMCGPAVTVKLDHLDILMGYTAAKVIQPGDVIVVAAQGNTEVAVWGGSMTRSAENAGAAGVVVDGAHEATWSLVQRTIPVFSRGASLATGTNLQGGTINVPIAAGNVCVHPGDLVIGNRDGVIVVPKDELEETYDAALEHWGRIKASIEWMNTSKGVYFDYANLRERTDAAGVTWE